MDLVDRSSVGIEQGNECATWLDNLINIRHTFPTFGYQETFGSKSLKAMGLPIWNRLPNEIKSTDNLNSFKNMIRRWDGPTCKYAIL